MIKPITQSRAVQPSYAHYQLEASNYRRREVFSNFSELQRALIEGQDYWRETKQRNSPWLVTAIHGGLEPGTTEWARLLAGNRHSLYVFHSLLPEDNLRPRISSSRFDDFKLLTLAEQSEQVLAVHGCRDVPNGRRDLLFVGGLSPDKQSLITLLRRHGISAVEDRVFPGTHPDNICNRGELKAGLQLELPRSLRDRILQDPQDEVVSRIASVLRQFLGAPRTVNRESAAGWL